MALSIQHDKFAQHEASNAYAYDWELDDIRSVLNPAIIKGRLSK